MLRCSLAICLTLMSQTASAARDPAPVVQRATPEQAAADEIAMSVPYMLGVMQQTRITVDFDRTPAQEAFKAVGAALDFPLRILYCGDVHDLGIDATLPIDLRVRDAAFLSVLEMLLDQCSVNEQCMWQFRLGMVEAGPKSVLNRPAAQEVRSYYIRDLLLEPPYFRNSPVSGGATQEPTGDVMAYVPQAEPEPDQAPDDPEKQHTTSGVWRPVVGPYSGNRSTPAEVAETLMLHIADTYEPAAWDINGGQAAGMNWRQDLLIVRAPEYIHRRIVGTPPPLTAGQILEIRAMRSSN